MTSQLLLLLSHTGRNKLMLLLVTVTIKAAPSESLNPGVASNESSSRETSKHDKDMSPQQLLYGTRYVFDGTLIFTRPLDTVPQALSPSAYLLALYPRSDKPMEQNIYDVLTAGPRRRSFDIEGTCIHPTDRRTKQNVEVSLRC